ncbi:YhbY family RNA-binding protein [Gammaproteobacteria bacterium]|nr:YhbY family RNA-binding protein [Gammaproteobacteria bacterium]
MHPSLDNATRRKLLAHAHSLKPVVTVGAKGMSETVIREIDLALEAHELIKVKLPTLAAGEKKELSQQVAERLKAHAVQQIGRVAIFWRRGVNPKIDL